VRVAELGQKPRAVTQLTQSSDRRRRADGERSRAAILRGATELATLDGLEGLSIAGLADHIGMSKSGLYAHFGSKEELQLATIEKAQEIFDREVAVRARAARGPRARARNVRRLSVLPRTARVSGWLHLRGSRGGVRHPRGPRAADAPGVRGGGMRALAEAIRKAQAQGEIDPEADADQLALEIDALLHGANAGFLLSGDREPLERARRAIRDRLGISRA
jgi:AcrR family transcriptional regulator